MRLILLVIVLGVYTGGYAMVRFLNSAEVDGQTVVSLPSDPGAVRAIFGPAAWVDNLITGATVEQVSRN
ncbi:hypothetical protein [Pseudaestuariivita sp.]|uniref:hypothetical protein n=1 Tax=Pseudaestuariivita sp. TaxID=2211669 RepID=UPI004057CD37